MRVPVSRGSAWAVVRLGWGFEVNQCAKLHPKATQRGPKSANGSSEDKFPKPSYLSAPIINTIIHFDSNLISISNDNYKFRGKD